jgi:hypothetical protein
MEMFENMTLGIPPLSAPQEWHYLRVGKATFIKWNDLIKTTLKDPNHDKTPCRAWCIKTMSARKWRVRPIISLTTIMIH